MSEAYERWLVPTVFQPFAVDLARRAADHEPARILEIAAGTGVLTRELLRHGGAVVVATDLNPAMVEVGRQAAPAALWRQADVTALPFDAGEFDVIVCQFGAMFFPDKPGAFAEVRRVLAPGGTVLLSVWGALEAHAFQSALAAALERAFPDDPPTFIASVVHGYADPEVIVTDLRSGGLQARQVEAVTLEGRAASTAAVAAGYCHGTPLRAELEARGDLASAAAAITQAMEARLGPGPVTGLMTALVVVATSVDSS
jgi:SAM-dependent methyltransferase